mmetsp:Transcript_27138/g.55301  ORF Transcript_27138/g.55301 Transcript_27138/m.55301 type:complete len:214 (+) Transcript_27138:739-1380(+)
MGSHVQEGCIRALDAPVKLVPVISGFLRRATPPVVWRDFFSCRHVRLPAAVARGKGIRVVGAPQKTTGALEGNSRIVHNVVRPVADIEGAHDRPVSKLARGHLVVCLWARILSKVLVGEDGWVGDGLVPVRHSREGRVDAEESVFELQNKCAVPSDEMCSQVGLIPSRIRKSNRMLDHEIIPCFECRPVLVLPGDHRLCLHHPHCVDHLAPLI